MLKTDYHYDLTPFLASTAPKEQPKSGFKSIVEYETKDPYKLCETFDQEIDLDVITENSVIMSKERKDISSKPESARWSYQREVGKIPLLTEKEERECTALAAAGDENARTRLITSNLRLVCFTANRFFQMYNVEYNDLIQEGNLGLMKAAEKFDPSLGYKFATYAVWWIRKYMVKHIAQFGHSIKMSEQSNSSILKLRKYITKYAAENNGEHPTVAEMAEYMGKSTDYINYLLNAAIGHVSLQEQSSNAVNDEEGHSLEELLPDDIGLSPTALAESRERYNLIMNALDILTTKERRIVELRYGLIDGNTHTYEELHTEFNLSRQAIQQIDKKAQRKIYESSFADSLREYGFIDS